MSNQTDTTPSIDDQLRYETALRIIGLWDRREVSMTSIEKCLRDHDKTRDERKRG